MFGPGLGSHCVQSQPGQVQGRTSHQSWPIGNSASIGPLASSGTESAGLVAHSTSARKPRDSGYPILAYQCLSAALSLSAVDQTWRFTTVKLNSTSFSPPSDSSIRFLQAEQLKYYIQSGSTVSVIGALRVTQRGLFPSFSDAYSPALRRSQAPSPPRRASSRGCPTCLSAQSRGRGRTLARVSGPRHWPRRPRDQTRRAFACRRAAPGWSCPGQGRRSPGGPRSRWRRSACLKPIPRWPGRPSHW